MWSFWVSRRLRLQLKDEVSSTLVILYTIHVQAVLVAVLECCQQMSQRHGLGLHVY